MVQTKQRNVFVYKKSAIITSHTLYTTFIHTLTKDVLKN